MAIALTAQAAVFDTLDWEVRKQAKGITASTAEVLGQKNLAFKGETVMRDVTIEQMIDIMRDVPGMSAWLHTCYEPKVVKEESDTSRIIHMRNETPTFLVSDRDLVLRQDIRRIDATHAQIDLTGLPEAVPAEKGFVRIKHFEGSWLFEETAGGLKVVYEGVIDPSGALPAWVTNVMVVDTPFETLRKLRDVAAKRPPAAAPAPASTPEPTSAAPSPIPVQEAPPAPTSP